MGSALAAIVIGVPSLFWGTRMTISGLYEQQQAAHERRRPFSVKLWVGAGLMILGIALLWVVAMAAFTV
jgi:hypothetical protein